MATTKATEKKTAPVSKTATTPIVKDTEAKKTTTAEVKTEAVKKEPAKKAPAKKATGTATKTPAKRTTAKKTTKAATQTGAKKTTTSTRKVVTELFVQFSGYEVSEEELVKRVKEAWVSEGNKVSSIKNISLYVKPEERKAYYVINKSAAGALDI